MLKPISNVTNIFKRIHLHKFYSVALDNSLTIKNEENTVDDSIIKSENLANLDLEDIKDVAPYLKPTYNFAQYVNQSPTLQNFLHLGVNLHKLEKNPDIVKFILGLDFERDVAQHLSFFHNLTLTDEEIGYVFTRNPFILKESIDDLTVRVNYLTSKKFTQEMIHRIISKNPFWLSFSTQSIDKMLGFYQKRFSLTGDETRHLAHIAPKIITYNPKKIKVTHFALLEEMGFTPEQIKSILLSKPLIFKKDHNFILETFEYLTTEMKIPIEDICEQPGILTCRLHRLKQRHLFLKELGKDQFNPKLPNYVHLTNFVAASDAVFSTEIAKSSIQMYNTFLKTL